MLIKYERFIFSLILSLWELAYYMSRSNFYLSVSNVDTGDLKEKLYLKDQKERIKKRTQLHS